MIAGTASGLATRCNLGAQSKMTPFTTDRSNESAQRQDCMGYRRLLGDWASCGVCARARRSEAGTKRATRAAAAGNRRRRKPHRVSGFTAAPGQTYLRPTDVPARRAFSCPTPARWRGTGRSAPRLRRKLRGVQVERVTARNSGPRAVVKSSRRISASALMPSSAMSRSISSCSSLTA